MASTNLPTAKKALRPLAVLRSLSGLPDRINRLEDSISDAHRRIDELQTSLLALSAVRTDMRDLTEHLTEELNQIAATLSAPSKPQ